MAIMHSMKSSYHGDPGRMKRVLKRGSLRFGALVLGGYAVWCILRTAQGTATADPWLRLMQNAAAQTESAAMRWLLPAVPPLMLSLLLFAMARRVYRWIDPDSVGPEQAGADGEAYVRDVLKRLPNTCHVYTSLEFSTMGRDGKQYPHETDCVVVGPAGVSVVEVKNWSGRIDGGYADEHIVRTRKNGRQERGVHNPVHQVQVHAGSLGALLRNELQHPIWVESYVFFVADSFENGLRGSSNTTVLKRGQEKQLLRSVNDRVEYTPEAVKEIVRAIDRIADNR